MTRTPPASVLSLSLFTLAVACQRPSSATNHPLPLRKLDGPPIARTFWLAHNDAEVLVSATLGYEIRLLAQGTTPGSALPYREVVMFAINGATFCRHTLPWSEQHACEPPAKANAHADPYKFKGEVLGFAKLTYTSLRDVAVEQIRVVPGDWPKGMLLAHADPEDFPYDPTNLVASHNADHNVRRSASRTSTVTANSRSSLPSTSTSMSSSRPTPFTSRIGVVGCWFCATI